MLSLRMRKRWIAVVAAAVFAVGCSKAEEYPDDVVREWGSECMALPGATVELCSCVLEGIQREYTLQQWINLVAQIRAGERGLPPKIFKISQECDKKEKGEPDQPQGGTGPAPTGAAS